jgi:hypothetical protein
LSREVAEDAVPEISALAAVEEDVRNSLLSRPVVAVGASNIWHSSGEEEVVEPDLLSLQLHQQRALLFSEPLVEPEYLFGGRRCVSVGCAALCVCAPLHSPCPLRLYLAPSFHCRLYGVQVGRRVCRYVSATVFPPSGGLLGRLVDGLVSGYAHVGWYPSDGHCPSLVLKLLDLLGDVCKDVGARSSFHLGDGPDGGLIVCVYGDVSSRAVSVCILPSDLQCLVDAL